MFFRHVINKANLSSGETSVFEHWRVHKTAGVSGGG